MQSEISALSLWCVHSSSLQHIYHTCKMMMEACFYFNAVRNEHRIMQLLYFLHLLGCRPCFLPMQLLYFLHLLGCRPCLLIEISSIETLWVQGKRTLKSNKKVHYFCRRMYLTVSWRFYCISPGIRPDGCCRGWCFADLTEMALFSNLSQDPPLTCRKEGGSDTCRAGIF